MEVVRADNELCLVVGDSFHFMTPLTRGFYCCLDGFCAGVHGQSHFHLGQVVKLLIEQRQLIIAERARSQRDALSLLMKSFQDLRVAGPRFTAEYDARQSR